MKLALQWLFGSEVILLVIMLLGITGCADKLSTINHTINQHPYSVNYTCQDYVTDKYKALILAGYKDKDMQFVITSYQGQAHVVLNVNGWILDNLHDKPYLATEKLENGLNYHYWNYYRENKHVG